MTAERQRIWGWYFFDWASQPYNTLLLTFIFGPYFAEIARGYYMGQGLDETAAKAAAQAYWAWGLAIASLAVAILAPILGAIADGTGRRMVWVWIFSVFYVIGAAGLWWVAPGGDDAMLFRAVLLFGIGFIGMEFATIFTNALMPGLTQANNLGAVSGNGFALGYLGGVVALVIMLLFFTEGADSGRTLLGMEPLFGLDPEAREGTRFVGPFTALWFVLFMIPFFWWVREPKTEARPLHLGRAFASLRDLIRSLRYRRSLTAYLASSLFYRDALNALYGFGGIYASGVLGWSIIQIGTFGIVGAITAVVAAFLGGQADRTYGPKPVIRVSIIVLVVVCCVIVGMTRESLWGFAMDPASNLPDQIFYVCGALIGAAGGTLQAASRTMMSRHTTPDRATEAFGLYALSGRVASFMAPALIGLATTISGDQRIGIAPLILLFLVGLFLLSFVKPRGELDA